MASRFTTLSDVPTVPPAIGATLASNKADNRAGTRLTRSSSRAAAQPNELVALAAVADHGVGGVDGLVGDQSRQPQQRQPERRRHHPIGEILGAGFDRRPAYAGFIQLFRVTSDDHGNGFPGIGEAALDERQTHAGDVLIEASLRDENRSDQRDRQIPHRKLLHGRLNQDACRCR